MDSLKRALVNVAVNPKEDNAPINPTAAPEAAATPTSEPTFTFTESQLRELMASAAARDLGPQAAVPASTGAPTVVALREATKPEACATHKLLTQLEQFTSRLIVGTRDRVVVPGNLYLVDKASPLMLALVTAGCLVAASGARKASDSLARLAESAAAKSSGRCVR